MTAEPRQSNEGPEHMTPKKDRKWSTVGGVLGAIVGGSGGFVIREKMNEAKSIGFANMPEEILKLVIWALTGAVILAFVCFFCGKAMEGK